MLVIVVTQGGTLQSVPASGCPHPQGESQKALIPAGCPLPIAEPQFCFWTTLHQGQASSWPLCCAIFPDMPKQREVIFRVILISFHPCPCLEVVARLL